MSADYLRVDVVASGMRPTFQTFDQMGTFQTTFHSNPTATVAFAIRWMDPSEITFQVISSLALNIAAAS